MKNLKVLLLLFLMLLISSGVSHAENFSMISDIMNAFSYADTDDKPTVKLATDKFLQANIKSSREDFSRIMNSKNLSVTELLYLNEKLYELGFFQLANLADLKISDDNFSFYKKTVQEFYKPKYLPTLDEELFLAEVYSNIMYNDRQIEAIKELLEDENLLKKSDYANYLLALGYYKTNNFKPALKAVNEAIDINGKCENYKFLKIKLLAEMGRKKEAMRLFNSYNNKKELPYSYRKKCELLKQFILYKTEKNQWERNYALGRYYYTTKDNSKALKSLQNASLTKNKKDLTRVWGIMSRTYLKLGDEKKAFELASKAYKYNSSNKDANVTLARIYYKDKDYNKALEHFKKAVKKDKLDTSIIKVAQIYDYLNETEKAIKIYRHLIKKGDDEWESYYNLALLDKNNRREYLLKSLKYNPVSRDSWIELAKTEIENENYSLAKEYLKNLYYIDDKDFRYYYYQGLISKNLGDKLRAAEYLDKCIDLNPDYYEARKELTELKENI